MYYFLLIFREYDHDFLNMASHFIETNHCINVLLLLMMMMMISCAPSGPEELLRERERMKNAHLVQVKEEPDEKYGTAEMKHEAPQDVDPLNLFLQKPDSFSKLSKLLEMAKMSSEVSCHQYSSPKQQTTLPRTPNHDVKPDHNDSCLLNNTYLTNAQQQIRNEQLYKVLSERNAHWFSLLPRSPCDVSSLTEGPASSSSAQTTAVSAGLYSAARINNFSLAALQVWSCRLGIFLSQPKPLNVKCLFQILLRF